MSYCSCLPEVERERYKKKLQLLYNSTDSEVLLDPFIENEEKWKDDITLWPPIEFGQIYTYLIDSPGQFTREQLKAYKSLEAFNYYIRSVSI